MNYYFYSGEVTIPTKNGSKLCTEISGVIPGGNPCSAFEAVEKYLIKEFSAECFYLKTFHKVD